MPQLRVPDTLRALHTIAAQHRRSFNGPLVAITGSCGKTSTKDLLRRLLGNATTHATQGNYNNHLGVPLTLLSIDPKKHRTSIIEIGMNAPGEIAPLTNLTVPQIGIVTGIAPVHLQGLGSLERIADEKAEMLHRLPRKGNALFPLDCLQYPAFRKIVAPARILAPRGKPLPQGLNAEQVIDYWSWETSQKETRIGIAARKASPTATPQYFTVSFQGPGMVRNTALAIITASTLGISDQDIQKRLAGWQPSPLRGEIVQKGKSLFYIDCYNANPASMEEALKTFTQVATEKQPRLYVISSMAELGEAADPLHYETGQMLRLRSQDRAWLIGLHSEAFRRGLLAAGAHSQQITLLPSVEAAQNPIKTFAGAIFLKGSRMYALERLLPTSTPRETLHPT